ncbi:MAG: beta-N-acetylhexosaminidase, partial [Peptostreptococcaceae bacterium]
IKRGNENYIKYKNKNQLFRALGLYVQLVNENKNTFIHKEKNILNSMTTLVDVSRNAVYKVEEFKKFLVKLAFMGHDKCMIYTEDTYELDGYEYFGYLRGKYSKEELKELDDFAFSIGIEIIPCIQALGHLSTTLKWDYARDIKDTDSVLLVGEEKTYEFIEAMISTMRSVFRSKNIHIGMDEAKDIGRGNYLTKNGYRDSHELMIDHLNKVCGIVKKYDFTPMMWDDMFFRAGAPNNEDYYDVNAEISDKIVNEIPKEITLIYWDYYTSDEKVYSTLLKKREKFNNKIIFAGGIWKWLGYAPTYSKTMDTTKLALKQCKENGIKDIIATVWADEGAESPLDSVILGLILFGEHVYNEEVSTEWLNRRCEFLTKLSMNDFMALEEIDLLGVVDEPNHKELNPSKYLIYQDILLGAFDKHIENIELNDYYKNLANKYNEISNRTSEYKDLFELFYYISKYLEIKGDLGIKIKNAYLKNDKDYLQNVADKALPDLEIRLNNFHNKMRGIWYKTSKGHGFEVIDIRLGGVKTRIESTKYRLNQYLNNEINKIEELEEEKLYYSNNMDEKSKLISFVKYQHMATQNTLTW